MRLLFLSILILSGINSRAFDQTNTQKAATQQKALAPLRYTKEFILNKVLEKLNLALDPEIPLPDLKMASETKIEDYQKDLVGQWDPPPQIIINVYAAAANRIYLLDDLEYYKKMDRCIDDSLAHELTHYAQVKYRHLSLQDADDATELEAIDVQNWFREKFCQP